MENNNQFVDGGNNVDNKEKENTGNGKEGSWWETVKRILDFGPIIVSSFLSQLILFEYSSLVTFLISLLILLFELVEFEWLKRTKVFPKQLSITNLFFTLFIFLLAVNHLITQRWAGIILIGGLLLVSSIGLLFHKPFGFEFALDRLPANPPNHVLFITKMVSTKVTIIYVIVFIIMFTSSLLVVLLEQCDNDDNNCTLGNTNWLGTVIGIGVPVISLSLANRLREFFIPKWKNEAINQFKLFYANKLATSTITDNNTDTNNINNGNHGPMTITIAAPLNPLTLTASKNSSNENIAISVNDDCKENNASSITIAKMKVSDSLPQAAQQPQGHHKEPDHRSPLLKKNYH